MICEVPSQKLEENQIKHVLPFSVTAKYRKKQSEKKYGGEKNQGIISKITILIMLIKFPTDSMLIKREILNNKLVKKIIFASTS